MLSVNEAIDSLAHLEGKPVVVAGILRFEFECVAIDHNAAVERREGTEGALHIYPSSIWISVGSGSLAFNEEALKRWSGKRVSVAGILHAPDPKLGGCGHMSGWPAEILASQIERL